MAYAKINNVTNANMAKVSNVAKAAIGKIANIDAPSTAFSTKSLDFDGANDYITNTSTDITFDVGTISLWVKANGATYANSSHNFLMFQLVNKFNVFASWSSDAIKTQCGGHPAFGYGSSRGTTDIADGGWHHIVCTVSGGGSGTEMTMRVYTDGSLEDTDSNTATYTAATAKVRIGGNWYSSYYSNANIDEVGVWDVALDADAITQLYNSGVPTDLQTDSGNYDNSGDLVHYWRMGEGDSYPTIEDNEGSLDMTMTNMSSGDIVDVAPS
tara:strand:+ start:237 stop:1046 length:810 start_codon:yes stop_codon:yes gene_type:complete